MRAQRLTIQQRCNLDIALRVGMRGTGWVVHFNATHLLVTCALREAQGRVANHFVIVAV